MEGETDAAVNFAGRGHDEGGGQELKELGGTELVVLVSGVHFAEGVGVFDEAVNSLLFGLGLFGGERLIVDCDDTAERTVCSFDNFFFP